MGKEEMAIQRSVKQLHFGGWKEKEAAAADIRRFAMESRARRKSLGRLGVIPCLASMLDSGDDRRRTSALLALLELANGTHSNKALMVEAGVMLKLETLLATKDPSTRRQALALLLSLSSLENTGQSCNFSSADVLLPILAGALTGPDDDGDVKLISLTTLCNLSTKLDNVRRIVSNNLVPPLIRLLAQPSFTRPALATLANVVVTAGGRKEVEGTPTVPGCFVNALRLEGRPRCQELAAYVLMALAHGSAAQRGKMAEAGAVPAFLRVALLGSEVGRRRAMKLLEWVKEERGARVNSGSGEGGGGGGGGGVRKGLEQRRDMERMVKQSLDKNMDVMMRRARAPLFQDK